MPRISLVEYVHARVAGHLSEGGVALDATAGNGRDTLFLARAVGESGRVHGFDVQFRALANTRQRLAENGLLHRVTLHHADHAELLERTPRTVHGKVQAVMFNLGYLPGGDKTITTRTSSTLAALGAACRLLSGNGIISVAAYPGHPGGRAETAALAAWCARMAQRRCIRYETAYSDRQREDAPLLFVIHKQADLL